MSTTISLMAEILLDLLKNYVIAGIAGFVASVVVTRLFFRSHLQRRQLGEVIEWAMVEKTISRLESMTTILNRLVADIKASADELTERIVIAQDLEPTVKEASKNRKQP
ncbi:hypothetical protein AC482_04360 [miscellaneous Crenarchaeota group-15 archaeon DG-45]|uniref:Uncharacterized protein n=1 Tax=miscellaneous Crenarchaeota group-15 archaeon DG-45 TaxID=1685127 RepID=A0A0M0BNY1_9ARCH|nr:MAG: hypothetical protein AC482_04360 [miscellaneous Crenarchaeota group-15 archaeon DG-45]